MEKFRGKNLSRDEYNAILEGCSKHFVRPAAERNGVQAELTDATADLQRWLPESAAEKLRLFCALANKRTGSCHPMNRERWYDFADAVAQVVAAGVRERLMIPSVVANGERCGVSLMPVS